MHRGKIRAFPEFKIGEENIEVVPDYNYLGVVFNYNGLFNKQINKQVVQANRALYALNVKSQKLILPIDTQLELFDKIIKPILTYGSEIWGLCNSNQIEKFYRSFLRNLLSLNTRTANCMLYGETGTYPIQITIDINMVMFCVRLIQGKSSKISYTILALVIQLYNNGIFKSKWLCKIKSILDNCGLSFVWYNFNNVNPEWIKTELKRRLCDIYKQNWAIEVFSNSLCLNYRLMKSYHNFESYLTKLSFKERSIMCRFRCGSNCLPYTRNRFTQDTNMICSLCGSDCPDAPVSVKLAGRDRNLLVTTGC